MSDQEYSALSRDTVFDLLSNSRRRFVLHYLKREDGPVSLSDLAAQIASVENDIPVEDLTSQQRKRTYVSLYQTHIPKLEDAGAIEYDSESGLVILADGADEISGYFRQESTIPWQQYYLALVVIGVSLFVIVNTFTTSDVLQFVVGLGILASFAGLAGAHFLHVRRSGGEFPMDLFENN
ncbi:MAG: DUF7344 domain-containing protein [Halobacteriota archaeon]